MVAAEAAKTVRPASKPNKVKRAFISKLHAQWRKENIALLNEKVGSHLT
jgi:hypothetical protein